MEEKDRLKTDWGKNRNCAITFGKYFADEMLRDYVEPTRAKTPKGNPIGFSKRKQKAALLMILYSRWALSIKEIAKGAGVTPEVLHVWRTKEDFKRAQEEVCRSLGETISNRDLNEIENFWVRLLPFFNPLVVKPLAKIIKEKCAKKIPGYAQLGLRLYMAAEVRDDKTLKKWRQKAEIKELTKALIESYIDDLSSPAVRKILGPKAVQKEADVFKNWLFRELGLL